MVNINRSHRAGIDRIIVDLTTRCNYACKDCFYPTIDNASDISDDVVKWINGLDNKRSIQLYLLGGEPLLLGKGRLFELLAIWTKQFAKTVIFTNGSMIDEDIISAFSTFGINVRLTFYAMDAAKHDAYTGIDGSFDLVYGVAHKLEKAGIPLKLNLIFDGEDLAAIKTRGTIFDTFKSPRFIDARRPSNKLCRSGDEKELLNNRLMNNPSNYKPVTPFSYEEIMLNLNRHPCSGGKLFITTVGDVFNCIWKTGKPLASVSEISSPNKISEYLERQIPMRLKYSTCKQCEFCFLCFDCSALNDYSNARTQCKPYFCNYDPLAERYESRESKIFV